MTDLCQQVVVNGEQCIFCPAVAEIPEQPVQVITQPVLGWTASARSYSQFDRDCYVQFSAPSCLGNVIGLSVSRNGSDPRQVSHGFYLRKESGRNAWSIIESGVEKTAVAPRDVANDIYRIERVNGSVIYYVNGAVIYRSATKLVGSTFVVSCLFGSGDGVD
jgi:hypothetical protein